MQPLRTGMLGIQNLNFMLCFISFLSFWHGVAGLLHDNQVDTQIKSEIPSVPGESYAASSFLDQYEAVAPFSIRPLSSDSSHTESDCPARCLVMAYYPSWEGSTFAPDKVDFTRFDWVDFAFATPNEDFSLDWDNNDQGPALLKQLVDDAHGQGAKVKLSVGGWTGSKYFSPAVATGDSRKTFANNLLTAYHNYNLDGIDIDWEYPGKDGLKGNAYDPADTENFLSFLQTLRATLPPQARITAAVEVTTFTDRNGIPTANLTAFAEVLDWVLIMNYDLYSSSSKPGPNAPLYDGCDNSTEPVASAAGSFSAWTTAGFPPCKLVLGLPSYGYISSSRAKQLQTRSKHTQKGRKSVTIVNEDGGSDDQVQFKELIQQGALVLSDSVMENGSPIFAAAGGFERFWDNCSATPFLRSESSGQVVTYDDTISLGMKAAFVKELGMLGVNFFDVHGDSDNWDLTDSVRKSLRII